VAFLSPFPHATSRAQQLFVALMAAWFLASIGLEVLAFLADGTPYPFLRGLGVAGFVGIQLGVQDRIVAVLKACRVPPLARFLGAGFVVATIFLGLQIGILAFEIPRLRLDSISWLTSLPPLGMWLLGWYGTWWVFLRAGWVDASSSLLAAGVHWTLPVVQWQIVHTPEGHASSVLSPLRLLFIGSEEWWRWALAAPGGFFAGWALMFLPGAIAGCECRPDPSSARSLSKRMAGWFVPPLVALALALITTIWFLAWLHD